MGTRRSRHNKGRKPFYKDHNRTTLADIAPPEAAGWAAEAERFLHDRQSNAFQEARFQPRLGGYLATRIKKPDPALTATVKAYLAKRQEEQARHEASLVFPSQRIAPDHVKRDEFVCEPERVEPSKRDVLMQMFVDRKITNGQMHAGRRWQMDKELATIQPSRSIDWSTTKYRYQTRGSVTGHQWNAMRRRRSFIEVEGVAVAAFLDFCLDADRGRAGLLALTGLPLVTIEAAIEEMLNRLCSHFGNVRREKGEKRWQRYQSASTKPN